MTNEVLQCLLGSLKFVSTPQTDLWVDPNASSFNWAQKKAAIAGPGCRESGSTM